MDQTQDLVVRRADEGNDTPRRFWLIAGMGVATAAVVLILAMNRPGEPVTPLQTDPGQETSCEEHQQRLSDIDAEVASMGSPSFAELDRVQQLQAERSQILRASTEQGC